VGSYIHFFEYDRGRTMGGLREAIVAIGPQWLAIGGLIIGFVFGAIVFRTNFCTMGSVSDIVNLGDWPRRRLSRARRCSTASALSTSLSPCTSAPASTGSATSLAG
jgi:hypothetical protein